MSAALPRHTWPIGGVAQLGERVLCKHEVVGSIPSASTTPRDLLRGWPAMETLRGLSFVLE